MQVAYGVIEKAKLLLFLPTTVQNIFTVSHEVATQSKNQCESVFRHGVYCVVADIDQGHAAFAARIDIDHVIAGGGHGNQLELGQLRQGVAADRHLVGDGHGSVLQTLHYLVRVGLHMLSPSMRKRGRAQFSL